MLSCFIEPYRETEYKKISIEEIETLEAQIESIFIFCVVWSLCCTVDDKSRKKLDPFIKNLIVENKLEVGIKLFKEHPDKSIYNFRFDTETNTFIGWE
jgi:dynein heavy chain